MAQGLACSSGREARAQLGELPHDALLALLASASEAAAELRQSFPFLGVLPPEERDAIFAYFETL